MSKEKKVIHLAERRKVEAVETPERVDFSCFHCEMQCVMYPRAKPISVQHGLPTCKEWSRVELKKDDLERFLIKCGVHVLVPKAES